MATVVPERIKELINIFELHKGEYKHPSYNETQVRRQFLDPFFEALGWDVENRTGVAEAYKDVVHEDAIKIGGFTKAPDYCFRVGGVRKFFVEAKKPAENLLENNHHSFQLRRYAWSAKLPIGILTDFEEFVVYDTRYRPYESDPTTKYRIFHTKYSDFIERWEEIYNLFSKKAVQEGSLDAYADLVTAKRGTEEVDDAFLKEIERWRELLAKDLAKNNPELKTNELNFAVQKTVDRIIFLRISEDRGIESYGRLMALQNRSNIYDGLCELFEQADDKYNSGLFHFQQEGDSNENPDTLTLKLSISNQTLKDIIKNLYYPNSPYEFSVLPADVLGQVYEQFLGKVIRLTDGHRAIIEEKPEVRKAGGVYYTPTYIVDYIVKQTVGKLLEGKTAKQVEKIKILDPACGSGSFLLGAYQYLLDWHIQYYINNLTDKLYNGKNPVIYQMKTDEWRLTTAEKRRILLNNIYGVDIDSQAVEVTKLSLSLKVLEGESEETLHKQLQLFQERALPNMGNNIKCGNSLIGPDFYNQQTEMFDMEEQMRVNAFDWNDEFKEIIQLGGFDAVIGNPPYIRIQAMKEWAPIEVEFYKKKYISASAGNYDIYVVFVEKSLSLLNKNGLLGFILPHKFFNAQYGRPLRELLSSGKNLSQIVYFGHEQVFKNAITYTCLMFLSKNKNNIFYFRKVKNLANLQNLTESKIAKIEIKDISGNDWNFIVGEKRELFKKLNAMPSKLSDIADRIFQGLVTGADQVFILQNKNKVYYSEANKSEYFIEEELMHPLCKGSVNIRRYSITELTKSILFPYKLVDGKAKLLTVNELEKNYPFAWKYLLENKHLLEAREHGKWKNDKWYAFGRSQNLSEMEQIKILTPSIAKNASFTFDSKDFYYFVGSGGGGGGGYGITLKSNISMNYLYILGLLNSKLLDTYLKSFSSLFSGGYYAYNKQYIQQLPIKVIDFSNEIEKIKHDQIVQLAHSLINLNKQLQSIQMDQEKIVLRRQIESADRQIDQLVYELYGLTEEEIKIIENLQY